MNMVFLQMINLRMLVTKMTHNKNNTNYNKMYYLVTKIMQKIYYNVAFFNFIVNDTYLISVEKPGPQWI